MCTLQLFCLYQSGTHVCSLFMHYRFIRLHHFDANYLSMPDYIPADLK